MVLSDCFVKLYQPGNYEEFLKFTQVETLILSSGSTGA